jgi:hypothetical protein
MKFVFLFAGGPLDGNAFHFDNENVQPLDNEFGGKAWLDTLNGTVGRQFTVQNPNTPADVQGTVWEFRRHVYEVTNRAIRGSKILIEAKHICALPNSRSGSYDKKFAEFIKLLADTTEGVVLIHHPQVLGDNYEELVESLNRLANAQKTLAIVPEAERG